MLVDYISKLWYNLSVIDIKYKFKNHMVNDIKILLIDDEETCIFSTKFSLKNTQYDLIIASDGSSALEILEYESVDLILLDLMLPDIYGLDLLIRIRSDTKLFKIPVILQTGSSNWGDIKKAKEYGIEYFLRKPYYKDKLIEVLDQFASKITN